jgi:hypothetical protein
MPIPLIFLPLAMVASIQGPSAHFARGGFCMKIITLIALVTVIIGLSINTPAANAMDVVATGNFAAVRELPADTELVRFFEGNSKAWLKTAKYNNDSASLETLFRLYNFKTKATETKFQLPPGTLVKIDWRSNGAAPLFYIADRSDRLISFDSSTGKTETVLSKTVSPIYSFEMPNGDFWTDGTPLNLSYKQIYTLGKLPAENNPVPLIAPSSQLPGLSLSTSQDYLELSANKRFVSIQGDLSSDGRYSYARTFIYDLQAKSISKILGYVGAEGNYTRPAPLSNGQSVIGKWAGNDPKGEYNFGTLALYSTAPSGLDTDKGEPERIYFAKKNAHGLVGFSNIVISEDDRFVIGAATFWGQYDHDQESNGDYLHDELDIFDVQTKEDLLNIPSGTFEGRLSHNRVVIKDLVNRRVEVVDLSGPKPVISHRFNLPSDVKFDEVFGSHVLVSVVDDSVVINFRNKTQSYLLK